MRIILYGGSFNPPHLGHAAAAKTVVELLHPDLFLVVPDAVPPHKELEEGTPPFEARLALCRLAFRDVPNAEVRDMTLGRKGRCYSADTVAALRAQYPEDQLILLLGTDMFLCFESWYRYEYLLRECVLAVLPREEDERPTLEAQAEKVAASLEPVHLIRADLIGAQDDLIALLYDEQTASEEMKGLKEEVDRLKGRLEAHAFVRYPTGRHKGEE